jgi:hypothetical protein
MEKNEGKYILKGVFARPDTQNSGRIYPAGVLEQAIQDYKSRIPVESLEDAAERYKKTIAGGTGTLIEHYEKYFAQHIHNLNGQDAAAHYLAKIIKIRTIKLRDDYCT